MSETLRNAASTRPVSRGLPECGLLTRLATATTFWLELYGGVFPTHRPEDCVTRAVRIRRVCCKTIPTPSPPENSMQQADIRTQRFRMIASFRMIAKTGGACDLKQGVMGGATMRLLVLAVLTLALSIGVRPSQLVAGAAERPNIVLILSDDMGYSDIGCYGSEIDTPELDELAEQGLRFTQFYNTARCCPTRASLLSGLYPHQAGVGHMTNPKPLEGYRGELNRRCVTMAEVLRQSGYATYMVGKWHVTPHLKPESDRAIANWPMQRGFDRFYGTIFGAGSFYDPSTLVRGNQPISPFADPVYPLREQTDQEFYYTDAISDHAVKYIREHPQRTAADGDGETPFFMYVSYTAAHWPMHARERDIAKMQGRYDAGYDAVRHARYDKMVRLGVIDPDATVNWPLEDAWKETDYWKWDRRNMEVYAAMVHCMDRGIGQIVRSLEATGELDNTLILYLQDNGGCAERDGHLRGEADRPPEPEFPEMADDALQYEMQPKQTRDGFPVRSRKGAMAGPADTYVAYGRAWATVSNTPFREYKHWVHEGGIATPLIAFWPEGIRRGGELEHTPGHLIDVMATAVDVAGAEYPSQFHDGRNIRPMEGVSLRPLFAGGSISRDAIYWEHEGNRAVRVGDMKLVAKRGGAPWELYDLSKDRSEQHDLAERHPELVRQLADMWQAYAERAQVLPLQR